MSLQEIVIQDPPEIPEWTPEDQEILEWMFPALREPPSDYPEPLRLQRTRALNPREWSDLLSVV